MAKVVGQVFKLYESRYGGGSFRIENDQTYYNTNKSYPLPAFVVPGAQIEFEAGELRGKGRQVVDQSIRTVARQDAPATPAGGGGNRDQAIQYQSARKDALVMVGLMLLHGAVKLPEKDISKRAGVIEALVDRFTAIYFEDVGTLGALERTEPEEKVEVKPKRAAEPAQDSGDGLPD